MGRNVIFIVDTNLFHECQSLSAEDFPWGEIGDFNTIELIVTDPVLSELDRQKKDPRPRIKRRAVEAIAWVRAMLQSSADEHVFRQNTPRVMMRVSAQTPSLSHPNVLDLAVDDDRIVGVALALTRENPGKDIRILSDDTRPIAKSKALSIPFNFIPSSWKRQAEVDDQQKEISRLQAEITALQATHPVISLHADGVINRRITLSRTAFRPPSHEEINLLRDALRNRVTLDKIAEAFPAYRKDRGFDFVSAQKDMIFIPPTERDLEEYKSITYPQWIENVLKYLIALPKTMNKCSHPDKIIINLGNVGYRPAENVRIRFVARGSFELAPARNDEYIPTFPELPSVPKPPRGHWLQNGNPVAEFKGYVNSPFDIDLFKSHLYTNIKSQENAEDWYFEPSEPDQPVKNFELVCQRFRHGSTQEQFDLFIFCDSDEAILTGALEVEVSASNLGRSVTETFPITLQTTFSSPLAVLEDFLEQQDFIKVK